MFGIRMRTTDEGIQTGNPVNEPILHEELQCPVHGHGSDASVPFVELGENIVCADGGMAFPHRFQNALSDFRQTLAAGAAYRFGLFHRGEGAPVVIVVWGRKGGFNVFSGHSGTGLPWGVICYNITL